MQGEWEITVCGQAATSQQQFSVYRESMNFGGWQVITTLETNAAYILILQIIIPGSERLGKYLFT